MEINDLLAPLNPAEGQDLRLTPLFDDLKELRREDDHNVSYGIWSYDLKVANWDKLEPATRALLTQQTKDLEVLLWYIECLIHRKKIEGLVEGIQLLTKFAETFWAVFFPIDSEHRGALLEVFDRKLTQHLLGLNLCGHPDHVVTLLHWKNAQHMHQLVTRNSGLEEQLLNEYGMNLETVRNRFGLSTVQFVMNARENFFGVNKALKEFIALCDDRMPQAEVSFSETLKTLKDAEYVLMKEMNFYKTPEIETPVEVADKVEQDTPPQKSSVATASIHNRDDVYAALQELSQFLGHTEPHSPVPAILDMLIQWQNMPLQDIISQIRDSPAQYQLLYTMVGK